MARKRGKFNHEREFVVFKPFLLNGRNYARGEPFDKASVDLRRLRQLFDVHYITFQESEEPRPQNNGAPRSAVFLEEDIAEYAKHLREERERKNGEETRKEGQAQRQGQVEEQIKEKAEVGPTRRVARTVINAGISVKDPQ